MRKGILSFQNKIPTWDRPMAAFLMRSRSLPDDVKRQVTAAPLVCCPTTSNSRTRTALKGTPALSREYESRVFLREQANTVTRSWLYLLGPEPFFPLIKE